MDPYGYHSHLHSDSKRHDFEEHHHHHSSHHDHAHHHHQHSDYHDQSPQPHHPDANSSHYYYHSNSSYYRPVPPQVPLEPSYYPPIPPQISSGHPVTCTEPHFDSFNPSVYPPPHPAPYPPQPYLHPAYPPVYPPPHEYVDPPVPQQYPASAPTPYPLHQGYTIPQLYPAPAPAHAPYPPPQGYDNPSVPQHYPASAPPAYSIAHEYARPSVPEQHDASTIAACPSPQKYAEPSVPILSPASAPPAHPSKAELPRGQLVRIFCKANKSFNLAVANDAVMMVAANTQEDAQLWIRDSKCGIRIKDIYGHPAFILVNKACGKVLTHAKDKPQQVLLTDYSPDMQDDDVLWTESEDFGEGFKTVRMASDTLLNMTVLCGDSKSGGVKHGSSLVLDTWHKKDNQLWKIFPL